MPKAARKKFSRKEFIPKSDCSCQLCDFSGFHPNELRNSSICQLKLCQSLQKGNRTICHRCIIEHRDNIEKLFPNGRNENGQLIDPGTLRPINTCKKCGHPALEWRCMNMFGICWKEPGPKVITFSII